jgi:hypothetical protein
MQAICWHATVEVLGGLGSIIDVTSPTFRCVLGYHQYYNVRLSQHLDMSDKQPPPVRCRHLRVCCPCSSATAREAYKGRGLQIARMLVGLGCRWKRM